MPPPTDGATIAKRKHQHSLPTTGIDIWIFKGTLAIPSFRKYISVKGCHCFPKERQQPCTERACMCVSREVSRTILRTPFPNKKRNLNHRNMLGSRQKKCVLLAQRPRPFLSATRWASPCSTHYGLEPGVFFYGTQFGPRWTF